MYYAISLTRKVKNPRRDVMRKLLAGCSLTVLFIGLMVLNAVAAPVNGSIAFAGGVSPNTGSLATAASLTFAGIQTVGFPAPTDDFAGVLAGTPVAVDPFLFNPFVATADWWTFTSGPTTFSLDTTSATIVYQGPNFLNVQGKGLLHGTGFDDTLYYYSLAATVSAGGGTSFAAAISNSNQPFTTPEPSVLVMLGSALIGLVALGRKLKK
jgi:hypothetical protein